MLPPAGTPPEHRVKAEWRHTHTILLIRYHRRIQAPHVQFVDGYNVFDGNQVLTKGIHIDVQRSTLQYHRVTVLDLLRKQVT